MQTSDAILLLATPKKLRIITITNTSESLRSFIRPFFDIPRPIRTILLKTMRGGGAGCITATGNVNPTAIMRLYKTWTAADADAQQETLNKTSRHFPKVSNYSFDEGSDCAKVRR